MVLYCFKSVQLSSTVKKVFMASALLDLTLRSALSPKPIVNLGFTIIIQMGIEGLN